MEDEEIFFEIAADGNVLRVLLKNYTGDRDMDWIDCSVHIRAGSFSGQFQATFQLTDLKRFRQGLNPLYEKLKGQANFSSLEGQLDFIMTGDGLGHFETIGTASDFAGYGNTLNFTITVDQTVIKTIMQQLDKAIAQL